ncbi:unnamed protein product, partial [Rotaria magnacalcarata]
KKGIYIEQVAFSTGTDSSPMSVALADFNNDSALDITVVNNNIDSIDIFLGYGNGSFAPVLIH